MRRLVFSVIVASGLVLTGAGPALAEAAPVAADAKAEPGKKMCKIVDPRINEVSGLVATKTGYIVINDSTDVASHKRVFFLDQDCSIKKQVTYSGNGPRDTEDMVLSADGSTLWIADIGDNDGTRDNIALWKMPASGASSPKIYRLSYPAGEHHDAEALLLTGTNTPIVVTKEVGKPAVLFEPTAALKANTTTGVPLKKVGEFQPPDTDTPSNTFAHLARKTVSGGAIAPGGAKVVLRTYTDAYEWDVTDGNVVAAVKATPRKTPLENEPQGEAITYSSDGKYFYTASDMQGATETTGENANYILRYTPATKVVAASTDSKSSDDKATGAAWYSNLSLDDITYMVGGVGLLGAILVGFGVVGIMRARKKPPLEPASKVVDGGPSGPLPADAETELLAVGGPPARPGGAAQGQRSGVYGGGGARAGGAQQPGVYGGAPSAPAVPPRDGTPQRGGAPQRGGVYGGQGGGGQQGGGRPVPPAGRPAQGGQPAARPPQGQPGRAPQGGQPGGRPSQGGQPARAPQGGQPGGRPPQGGQPGGGRPGGSGVYGAPPSAPPSSGRSGPAERPGVYGSGDERRQAGAGMNSYADTSGSGQHYDTRGYGR